MQLCCKETSLAVHGQEQNMWKLGMWELTEHTSVCILVSTVKFLVSKEWAPSSACYTKKASTIATSPWTSSCTLPFALSFHAFVREFIREATLQECGSEIFLRFSLPKVSWNLVWNCGEIFRAMFSRVWVCDGKFHQNFTSKTVWKTKISRKFHSAGAQRWSSWVKLRSSRSLWFSEFASRTRMGSKKRAQAWSRQTFAASGPWLLRLGNVWTFPLSLGVLSHHLN